MRPMKTFVALVLLALFAPEAWAVGTTYYVDTNAGAGGAGGINDPYNTFAIAFAARGGSEVYILKNGTHSAAGAAISSAPAGTAAHPTMIKGQTLDQCIITRADSLTINVDVGIQFVEFHDLKWNYAGEKNITGAYIKMFRCRLKGGSASGNNVTFAIGSGSDLITTHDVYLEDVLVWGAGGRYKVLVYNAFNVSGNRVVARHDGGWGDVEESDPEAVFTVYDSSNVIWTTCAVIDSTNSTTAILFTYTGGFYYVNNDPVANMQLDQVYNLGTIVLGSEEYGYRGDANADCSSCTWRNVVAWNVLDGGFGFGSNSNFNVNIDQFAIGFSSGTIDDGIGIGDFGSTTGGIRNGIITGMQDDLNGAAATYVDTYNNAASGTGTGWQTYNPFANGYKFLTQITTGSNLDADGEGSTPMGPNIRKRYNVNADFFRRGTWATESSVDLWPWPLEASVKGNLCDGTNQIGFCDPRNASVTFSQYVQGYQANFTTPDGSGDGGGEQPAAPSGSPRKSITGGKSISGFGRIY